MQAFQSNLEVTDNPHIFFVKGRPIILSIVPELFEQLNEMSFQAEKVTQGIVKNEKVDHIKHRE